MQLTIYGKLSALEYALSNEAPPADAYAFYLSHYALDSGPVLEPMCGTGRFLIPFLQHGIAIDGMDASPHMLAACRQRCDEQGLSVKLYQQLIQELDLPQRYGYIFLPDRAIALLYDKSVGVHVLRRLYEHLLPGGTLALDIQTPGAQNFVTGQWQGDWTMLPDGSIVVDHLLFQWDEDEPILRALSKHELFVNGKLQETEVNIYVERFYTQAEFEQMLAAAGFVEIVATQAFTGQAPQERGNIAFVCRRLG
jgi:ubiquinone/menaquinone biosynthesis C-methylase UbiE